MMKNKYQKPAVRVRVISDSLMQVASTFTVSEERVNQASNIGFSKKQGGIWSNDEEE